MMKLHLVLNGGLARLLAMSVFMVGVMGFTQQANAAISSTKHNLSTSGTGSNKVTVGTDEICVFCHTPHGADTGTAGAPLWNKKLPAAAGYTPYAVTDSLDGEQITNIAGVSLPCLSCHDGTQAMDNIINAPGSGGYDATGGGATGRAYTWTTTSRINAAGQLTGGAAALGTDLSNDHPIGIQYCGGGRTYGGTTVVGGTCNDADFNNPTAAVIGASQRMWIDTGGAGRQKTDLFLFNRTFATAGAGPSVECASCHDVHSAQTTFLRVSNAASAVCLACHIK